MQFKRFEIDGPLLIEHRIFGDDRGYFFESFRKDEFQHQAGRNIDFVQDNISKSSCGVLRGLHFQAPPFAQAKMVRVVVGKVMDIIVDIRKGSPTYGKHIKVELSEENKYSLYVPVGFAHGFACLSESCIFEYKCSNYFNKESEGAIRWNDSTLDIDWGVDNPVLSDKDKIAPLLRELDSPFIYGA